MVVEWETGGVGRDGGDYICYSAPQISPVPIQSSFLTSVGLAIGVDVKVMSMEPCLLLGIMRI